MIAAMTIDWLREALADAAEPTRAGPMAAYMKGRFPFLGTSAPRRRAAQRPLLAVASHATIDDLLDFADDCWAEPEREFQYVAVDLLRKHARRLRADDLVRIENLILTKSWWDTVDGLAAWVVGPMVADHPDLAAVMDQWIHDDNLWLARTAILHQLSYKEATDSVRLFAYVLARADDPDFFIRKASGWALRQYARTDASTVRAFVDEHANRLSGLTRREAIKRL